MATYYAIAAGGNWNGGTIWSTVSTKSAARTGSVSTPTNADTCILDDWSGNVTVNSTTCTCAVFNCTINGTYTGTLAVNGTLTVAGNVTLSGSTTLSTTSGIPILAVSNTSTITSNGLNWKYNLTLTVAKTYTLSGDFTIGGTSGTVYNLATSGGGTATINKTAAEVLNCNGGINSIQTFAGTAKIVMSGTGNISTGVIINNDLEINTSGTITIPGILNKNGGTFTYTTGTVNWSGSTLTVNNSTATTLTLGSQQINNLTLNAAGVATNVTLSASLTVLGTFTHSGTGTHTFNGASSGYKLYCANYAATTGTLTGSGGNNITIEMNGTGSWTCTSGILVSDIIFNSGGLTITVAGTVIKSGGTIYFTSGVMSMGSSILNIQSSTTLSTGGMTWANVTLSTATQTLTLNSTLNVSSTFSIGALFVYTFAGTSGFNVANWSCLSAGATIKLKNGITYLTTSSVVMTGTSGNHIIMQSDDATLRAVWTLSSGATQAMTYVDGTHIDSSLGQTIWTFGGIVSVVADATLNWNLWVTPSTIMTGYAI